MTTARLASARPASRPGRLPFAPALGRACARGVGAAVRRPGVTLAAVALVGGGGLFGWNALTQQTARHPNPLFASGEARPVKTEAKADAPKAAPARPEPPRRAELAAPPAARTDPAGGDAIGALIKGGSGPEATASLKSPEPAAAAKPDPKVASAQKALTKLGYGPLKPDGVMGGRTREALLKFEKEKKLPPTGAVAGRTAKQLAALSGVAVE